MSEELMVLTPQMEGITGEILAHKANVGRSFLEIGRLLIEAKDQLDHGQWLPWLRERVEFSERSAQQLMQVARGYAENPQLAADLGSVRKAVALLALPEEERETFAQETQAASITARELEDAIKARKAAEQAAARAKADFEDALSQLTDKSRELEELKNRPVEVAVQTVRDEGAIKAAVETAEAKHKAAQGRLEQRIAELERETETLRAAGDQSYAAQQQLHAAQKEAERLRKQLTGAGNEDVLAVKLCYQQIVELANRMQGYILRMEGRGDAEAANCRKAVTALAGKLAEMGGKQNG